MKTVALMKNDVTALYLNAVAAEKYFKKLGTCLHFPKIFFVIFFLYTFSSRDMTLLERKCILVAYQNIYLLQLSATIYIMCAHTIHIFLSQKFFNYFSALAQLVSLLSFLAIHAHNTQQQSVSCYTCIKNIMDRVIFFQAAA